MWTATATWTPSSPTPDQANRVWLGIGGNKAPTLNALTNVTVDEDAPQQTVNLAGISAGSGKASR